MSSDRGEDGRVISTGVQGVQDREVGWTCRGSKCVCPKEKVLVGGRGVRGTRDEEYPVKFMGKGTTTDKRVSTILGRGATLPRPRLR